MESKYKVDRLDDSNYETWCIQLQSAMQLQRLWKYVKSELGGPENEEGNLDALAFLRLSVCSNQLRHIKLVATAYAGWKKLEEVHKKRGPAFEMMLYRKLDVKCVDIDNIPSHIENFFRTADEMASIGADINDNVLVYMLLNSLPKSFEYFEVAMTTRETIPKLSELKTKISDELERQKKGSSCEADANNENQAWMARNSQHWRKKKSGPCFTCGQTGHWFKECPMKNTGKSLLATVFGAKTSKSDWVIDSGANNHLVCESELLSSAKPINQCVEIANGATIEATKLGMAMIHTTSGDVSVNGAMFLPGLKVNLLSVSRATDRDHTVIFNRNGARIIDSSGDLVLTARNENGLFIVNEKVRGEGQFAMITAADRPASTDLWHRRLGHVNYNSLYRMANKKVVTGIDKIIPMQNNCEVCLKNKISEQPFPKSATNTAKNILDRVHSDICGPFRTRALCGAKYFATFIDECSRYCKVYPLKSRDEIGEAFGQYKSFVENQCGKHIKSVRTDNAAEYKGGEFARIIKSSGILHETSVAHCPQQNGIAERMNRTLMEMTRCMLYEAGFPDNLWVEALQTASYIRNRCESRADISASPFELFWGIKPSVQHLRVYGCDAVALIKGQNISKLHPKGINCRLVGYSSSQKGYRLIDPDNKVIISRSVRFMNETGALDEESDGMIDVGPTTKTSENVPVEEDAGTSEVPSGPRRNPIRTCRMPAEVTGAPVVVQPTEDEKKVPVLKVDPNTEVSEPVTFQDATNSSWSKWW